MPYLQGRLFDLKIHELVTHVRATYLLNNLILFVLRIFYVYYTLRIFCCKVEERSEV